MHAQSGDQVVIKSHDVGAPDRKGEVLEARGTDGTEPFLVRWDATGHTSLLFPGSDCHVDSLHAAALHATGQDAAALHATGQRTARLKSPPRPDVW